jgi:hypothetical protein
MLNALNTVTPEGLKFYLNQAFYKQQATPNVDYTVTDQFGTVAIPSKFHFWLILFKGQIYMINGRRGITQ